MYRNWRSNYQWGRAEIPINRWRRAEIPINHGEGLRSPLTGLMPPHFCACSKQRPGFPTPNIVGRYVFLILVKLLTVTVLSFYTQLMVPMFLIFWARNVTRIKSIMLLYHNVAHRTLFQHYTNSIKFSNCKIVTQLYDDYYAFHSFGIKLCIINKG